MCMTCRGRLPGFCRCRTPVSTVRKPGILAARCEAQMDLDRLPAKLEKIVTAQEVKGIVGESCKDVDEAGQRSAEPGCLIRAVPC
jgi:hypothetical protein